MSRIVYWIPEEARDANEAAFRVEEERIANLDFAKAYENVHSIGGEVETSKLVKLPKKMTIFRMYFRLNSISISELLAGSAAGVEELLVVADVVAIDGNRQITLPGNRRVVILCRLLTCWGDGNNDPDGPPNHKADIVICLSLQQDKEKGREGLLIDGRWVKTGVTGPGRADYTFRAPQFAPGRPTQLFVYARCSKVTLFGKRVYMDTDSSVLFSQRIVNFENTGPVHGHRSRIEADTWNLRIQTGRNDTTRGFVGSLYMHPPRNYDFYDYNFENSIVQHVLKEPSLGVSTNGKEMVPSHVLEDANVVMGLEVTLLSAEGILLYGQKTAGADAVKGALEHCKWLTTHVLANRAKVKEGSMDGKDQALRAELQTLYIRAQALVIQYGSGNPNMLVPALNYTLYRESIDKVQKAAELYDNELKDTVRQIQILRTTEVTAGVVAEAIGGNLLQHFKVLGKKEEDMENYTGKVYDLQKEELDKNTRKLGKLEKIMKEHQDDMTEAKADMEKEIEKHKKKKMAEAAFSILGAVFDVVGAIVTMGATAGSAIKKLSELPDKIEKLKDVLEKLQKVFEALKNFSDLLDSKPGESMDVLVMPEAPMDSDWDVFENEIESVVDQIPDDIGAAKVWRTKCKNVAALGRHISTVTTQVTSLKYQLKLLEWQREIFAKQGERLESLKLIKPAELDSSSVLQELVVQLDMRTQRMIISLVEMLNIQNAALYYNYLQKPEAVSMGAPNIHNVQQLLMDRELKTLVWREKIGKSSKQKKEYVVKEIPVDSLRSGKDFYFDISLEDAGIPKYWQRVRILHVELRFTGDNVPTTDTGEVFLVLRGDNVFYDRFRGETFEYKAAKHLKYPFGYDLETGGITHSNRDITTEEGDFMRMTPFSHWKLRVPLSTDDDPNENDGIRFAGKSGLTQVTITFHVSVIRKL